MWLRLLANSEQLHPCRLWRGGTFTTNGYGKVYIYVPGLGEQVALMAHIVSWLLHQPGVEHTPNGVYLAYQELRCSGLELDHDCVRPGCIEPKHLDPVTRRENELLKHERRRAAKLLAACS